MMEKNMGLMKSDDEIVVIGEGLDSVRNNEEDVIINKG